MYCGDWRPYITKNTLSFFHRKSTIYQPKAINKEDTIRTIVLTARKQWFYVSTAWQLRDHVFWMVEPRYWVISFHSFEKKIPPSLSWLWANLGDHNPVNKGGTFLWRVGKKLVSHTENLLPQCENTFATDTAKFAVDKAESFPLD